MIFKANDKKLIEYISRLSDKEIEIKLVKKTRTSRQNRALHLWFTQLSKALNENGMDMRKVIIQAVDIQWTPYSVKENLFRPTFKTITGKKSTTQLTTQEINQCFDIINKAIGERTNLHIPFPCIEQLMLEQDNNYV